MLQEDYIYDYGFSPDDVIESDLPIFEESTEEDFDPGAHGRAKAEDAKIAAQAKKESGKAHKPDASEGGPPEGGPPEGGPPGGGPPEGKGKPGG